MTSQDSSQSYSNRTNKSKKTFGELYGKATIDPPLPPPRNKDRDRDKQQNDPQPPDGANS